MLSLQGKVAIVTGGNSGIGLETAKLFAAQGAQVVITGRRKDVVDDAVSIIGNRSIGLQGDVADAEHHRKVADFVRERFGGIDVYVANAGIIRIQNTTEVSEADYDAQFSINARGTFFGVQHIAPVLRDGGAIICLGSIASEKVLEGHPVYAGTKASINAFARAWALELSSRRIRVNVLSPGPTDTAIVEKLGVPEADREGFTAAMTRSIPLARFGQPEEVARAALFLASDASSFVTGVNLRVDGGMALL
ncbi:glucose 1-dehydrogenase [Sphingomonas sp. MAH-20]|uniref:Glucose 1-dehydrogenase n=1 Tax=Sphingomonas horti TaxID=2682842 RepID=A0A6I4IXJ4_9SPHN|nr:MULTISPECIES: glucose 1-dehydrogenase [Sphingomonas]MBA2920868.1 glucose 1-dehydrogenase [Sphingomonas sp. CGMCC 1.13658]MVO76854.1 glucose 1-dehydrogenase [Sphingomonas horti]